MFNIIEAYRPYFNSNDRDKNTKKLHNLLNVLVNQKNTTSPIELFGLINNLFEINEEPYSLYEKIGPLLELKFGDKKCCSYRWGVDQLSDKTFVPSRCLSQRLPGFLYCSKHNVVESKICRGCLLDTKTEITHNFGWEHWGNIFEKNLRPVFTRNIKQFKILNNELLSYPAKYLHINNSILHKVEIKTEEIKPNLEIKEEIPKQIVKSKQPITKPKLLSGLLKTIEEPSLNSDERKTMLSQLLLYMLDNNLIKVSRNYPIKQMYIYDDDNTYYQDGKFVYMMNGVKMKAVGVYKDSDTLILSNHIRDGTSNYDFNDEQINSFVNSLN